MKYADIQEAKNGYVINLRTSEEGGRDPFGGTEEYICATLEGAVKLVEEYLKA